VLEDVVERATITNSQSSFYKSNSHFWPLSLAANLRTNSYKFQGAFFFEVVRGLCIVRIVHCVKPECHATMQGVCHVFTMSQGTLLNPRFLFGNL